MWRGCAAIGLGLGLGVGCLGLNLTYPPDVSDAGLDAGDASDAVAVPCVEEAGRGCSCPHLFCDDFDDPGQSVTAKWPGAVGYPSPFTRGAGEIGIIDGGRSPPAAAIIEVTNDKSTNAFQLLGASLSTAAGSHPRDGGLLRFAFDFLIETIDVADAGGRLAVGSTIIGALVATKALPVGGAALYVTHEGFYLVVIDDIVSGSGMVNETRIVPITTNAIIGRWFGAELLIGSAESAARSGFQACEGITGNVAVGVIVGASASCLPLPNNLESLLTDPGLSIGSILLNHGGIRLRFDNVVADYE